MGRINEFIRWAKKESYYQGIICHFYISESTKQYYDNTDYAYFNLFYDSQKWLIKGTTGHGIKSQREKRSTVPCLNCFEVNNEFYKAIKQLYNERSDRFELGLLLNKRKIKDDFKVIDVSIERPSPLPPPNRCHYYDNPRFKKGVLQQFNYCDIVRIEIPKSNFHEIAIKSIPTQAIIGILVKRKDRRAIINLLKLKKMDEVEVFPIL